MSELVTVITNIFRLATGFIPPQVFWIFLPFGAVVIIIKAIRGL